MSSQSHNIRVGPLEIYAEEVGHGSPALVFVHYWGGSPFVMNALFEEAKRPA
jgi:hypothetical protein